MRHAMMMRLIVAVALLIATGVVHAQLAGGPYVIETLDINAGGTTSSGGPYSISASTGQAGGVGTITAEPLPAPPLYQFDDGFWSTIAVDCNQNNIPDELDIATGGSQDGNGSGVPDECEQCVQVQDCVITTACMCRECGADGACQYTAIFYGDVNCMGGPTPVDVDDVICMLDGFASYAACPNADIAGCAPNGIIDVDDVIALLDAFAGIDPCGCTQ